MKTIQYPLPNYQPLPGMVDPITVRTFRGVNTYDPFSIDDSYFTDISNFMTDDFPTMTVRPGYTKLGSTYGTKVLGIGTWKDQQLHAVFNDGVWRRWDGTTWQTVLSGLSTTANCYFTNFKGNQSDECLFMTNGVNGLKKWDGTSAVAFGDAPSDINFITTYSNRLWGASGKELHASSLNKPDKWNEFDISTYGDEASYAKTLETTRGEKINMVMGGLSKLMIGMPNSLHEMYGNLPSDFSFRLITEETGIANNQSGLVQDAVFYEIHVNGIYQYVTGGVGPDRSFSDSVKAYFTNINNSVAATDGKKFYFQIEPGKILVYDPRLTTWTVYNGINATCFAIFQNQFYIGDDQGRVLRLGGTDDAGTPITAYAVTKPFTNASVAQRMRWLKMWTFWELAAGSTLNIYFSATADGNDWDLLQTITGTGTQIQRVIIPVDKFQYENMVRIKFETIGWARLHEHTRKYRQLPLY